MSRIKRCRCAAVFPPSCAAAAWSERFSGRAASLNTSSVRAPIERAGKFTTRITAVQHRDLIKRYAFPVQGAHFADQPERFLRVCFRADYAHAFAATRIGA